MKHLSRIRVLAGGVSLCAVLLLGAVGSVYAAPAATTSELKPPATRLVSGKQDKPSVEPGSRDAKLTEQLGPTNLAKTNAEGKPLGALQSVAVAGVDFQTPMNYCWKNLVYMPVKNTTTAVKYVQVRVYNQTGYRDIYTSVSPNGGITYPAFYGVDGSYTAYLYVWNGSTYQYDETKTGSNVCNVSVTRVYDTGGWVQLKISEPGNRICDTTVYGISALSGERHLHWYAL